MPTRHDLFNKTLEGTGDSPGGGTRDFLSCWRHGRPTHCLLIGYANRQCPQPTRSMGLIPLGMDPLFSCSTSYSMYARGRLIRKWRFASDTLPDFMWNLPCSEAQDDRLDSLFASPSFKIASHFFPRRPQSSSVSSSVAVASSSMSSSSMASPASASSLSCSWVSPSRPGMGFHET